MSSVKIIGLLLCSIVFCTCQNVRQLPSQETPMEETANIGELLKEIRLFRRNMERRFDGFASRLNDFEKRLDSFGTRFDGFGSRLDGVGKRLNGFGTRLDGFRMRLDGFGTNFDKALADIEVLADEVGKTPEK